MTAIDTTTDITAGRGPSAARHRRFWLAVAAVMVATLGLALITVGVMTDQPGLILVASTSLLAGGASVASAYSVHRRSQR